MSAEAAHTEPKPEQQLQPEQQPAQPQESAAPSVIDEKPTAPEATTPAAPAEEQGEKKSNPLKEILKVLFGCLRKQVGDQLKDAGVDEIKKEVQDQTSDAQNQVQQAQQQGQDPKDAVVTSSTGVAAGN